MSILIEKKPKSITGYLNKGSKIDYDRDLFN